MDLWPKVTLFGDSLTRLSMNPDAGCWASYINQALINYHDVDIRAFDGFNSTQLLELTPKLFTKEYLRHVDVMVIFIGHNDCWETDLPFRVPLGKFFLNYSKILGHIIKCGLKRSQIVVVSPAWYHDRNFTITQLREGRIPLHKSYDHAKLYSDTILRIAKETGIESIDFFGTTSSYIPLCDLFSDGLNLSKLGSKLLYSMVMPSIKCRISYLRKVDCDLLRHTSAYDEKPGFKDRVEEFKRLQPEVCNAVPLSPKSAALEDQRERDKAHTLNPEEVIALHKNPPSGRRFMTMPIPEPRFDGYSGGRRPKPFDKRDILPVNMLPDLLTRKQPSDAFEQPQDYSIRAQNKTPTNWTQAESLQRLMDQAIKAQERFVPTSAEGVKLELSSDED